RYNGGGGGTIAAFVAGLIFLGLLAVFLVAFWHRSKRLLPRDKYTQLQRLVMACCLPVYATSLLFLFGWSLGSSFTDDAESDAMLRGIMVAVLLASIILVLGLKHTQKKLVQTT